jgi:hypothetical protein
MSRRINAQANSYSAGDSPREVTLESASNPFANRQDYFFDAITPNPLISIASQRMYLEDNLRAAENEQTISIIEAEIARAQADRHNARLLSDRTTVEHAWDDLERTRRLQDAILDRRAAELAQVDLHRTRLLQAVLDRTTAEGAAREDADID